MMKTLSTIFSDRSLRKRILFVLFILVITRILAVITLPGIDATNLANFLANSSLGLLNIFSGGGLASLSIVMLGVGPYITASIIMQLSTVLIPRLKEMQQEEGDIGRRKFVQYGRILTIPFAILQGLALLTLLSRKGTIPMLTPHALVVDLIIITAGTVLLMWLGEQINERGVGNGISLIIFAGIVAQLPQNIARYFITFDVSQIPMLVAFVAIALVTIGGIVFITEAERPLPVTYAKQSRAGASQGFGYNTYIPIRLNQAGVVPIIFAISILLFPQLLSQLFALAHSPSLVAIAAKMNAALANVWIYGSIYFLLVFIFTYFYTAIIFDPEKTADNIQKNGAFIPGFRPGTATAEYIGSVLSKVTLVGALFLGVVAVLPYIVQHVTGVTSVAIGGTSLLIAISVILDVVKKVDAQLSLKEY